MKNIIALFLITCTLTVNAEEWKASFTAPNNAARPAQYQIVLDLPDLKEGEFQGQVLKVYGASICRYPVSLKGVVKGEELRFLSETNEIKGCGQIKFNGKKVGETLEGIVPFHGIQAQVVFKK